MRLNPEYLVTFSVVAEYGNISRAAEALRLSQPAVSGQLKALQDLVGERLYTRTAYGITLTDAGRDLLGYARVIASTLTGAAEHLRARRNRARPLRLGLSWTLGAHAVNIVAGAHADGQAVRVTSGHSAALADDVATGTLDAALIVRPAAPLPPGLDAHRFRSEELSLLVPDAHPLAALGATPLLPIAPEPFLWPMVGSTVARHAERLLNDATVIPEVQFELGSLAAVREALVRGLGVTILPPSVARLEIDAGHVTPVLIEAPNVTVEYVVVTPSDVLERAESRRLLDLVLRARRPTRP
ncbi:LysR family transcriptional regulator [Deinococcus maricopensis]|uniref:Transcriptional regulator, LysR family n=1 Tax=Deinococcus maricopensis (strain DSM 21211 / LMG 22137 / NRRL B-23946 / LB-34) TaxID=709986 RepID=E8U3B3_DEIML|nr:LysR family transcriptional regulator [Deinococcus maricopensis]ADV65784.1 transcriptional regulator, LysR family [Deinococcus maricopensis DSM 21211]